MKPSPGICMHLWQNGSQNAEPPVSQPECWTRTKEAPAKVDCYWTVGGVGGPRRLACTEVLISNGDT